MTSEVLDSSDFASLGIQQDVLESIADMGWSSPTPVQRECYPLAIAGHDLIVQSRTGTGKTGAFGIPIVDRLVTSDRFVQALILAPTRELALQSARELGKLGAKRNLDTAAVYGGAGMDRQIRELSGGAQLVSGTPGRVLDHLRRGTLDTSHLKILVLDEADEMLSMGFAKELHAILEMLPKEKQTFLFSATVDGPIERMGERHMRSPKVLTLSGDAVGALGITHLAYMVSGKGRGKDLVRILEVENPESAIIFCNTKAETETVAGELKRAGYDAEWLNGDLPQGERESVMGRTRAGNLRFLVATDVAARGIDISHLTHVINFALPEHLEQYIHRTGRTGRAGRTGTAITLVAPTELGTLYYLRLQYKIFPVERSLPTQGEHKTRAELDRLALLQGAFGKVQETELALARRLLSHADAERLVAGLLGAFFGATDTTDESAAEARRAKNPEPIAEPSPSRGERQRPRRESPRREGPSGRNVPRRDEGNSPQAEAQQELSDPQGESTLSLHAPAKDTDGTRLFLSCGKRDGIRPGDIIELITEEGQLEREAIGSIQIRDRHTFVTVPPERAVAVVEALSGKDFRDRPLKIEVARA